MLKHALISLLVILAVAVAPASAQEDFEGRSLTGIKADFKSVGVVAHVKINQIELAAADLNPLYRVESEIIEPFKGKQKRGEILIFYFNAENGFERQKLIGKERIVFLEVERPIPSGGQAWFELENSKLIPSKKLVVQLRKLTKAKKA